VQRTGEGEWRCDAHPLSLSIPVAFRSPLQGEGGETPLTYIFQRGETVALALAVVSGDPAIVGTVTAAMKPAVEGRSWPDPAAPAVADFTVSFVAASGADPARWFLTLTPAVTAALAAGDYLADAKLTVGGGVAITETIGLRLRDAVTS